MHQPITTQVGFQYLLDSGVRFPAHAQKKKNKPNQNKPTRTTRQINKSPKPQPMNQPTTKTPKQNRTKTLGKTSKWEFMLKTLKYDSHGMKMLVATLVRQQGSTNLGIC